MTGHFEDLEASRRAGASYGDASLVQIARGADLDALAARYSFALAPRADGEPDYAFRTRLALAILDAWAAANLKPEAGVEPPIAGSRAYGIAVGDPLAARGLAEPTRSIGATMGDVRPDGSRALRLNDGRDVVVAAHAAHKLAEIPAGAHGTVTVALVQPEHRGLTGGHADRAIVDDPFGPDPDAWVSFWREAIETQERAGPSPTVDPNWPLQSFDAQDWAKAFMDLWSARRAEIDEALMLGWFACALMRGFDEARWRAKPVNPAPSPVLSALADAAGPELDALVGLLGPNVQPRSPAEDDRDFRRRASAYVEFVEGALRQPYQLPPTGFTALANQRAAASQGGTGIGLAGVASPEDPRSSALARAFAADRPLDAYGRR